MSASAGYSATPLPKKLGIKPGHRLLLLRAPDGFELGALPDGVAVGRRARGTADVIVSFHTAGSELARRMPRLRELMEPAAGLWIAWPKRASKVDTDLTEDVVRTGIVVGAVLGLVLIALNVLFLWSAWQGRNWARIVLWVLGGLSVLGGLYGLTADTGQTGFLTSLSVFQLLLLIAGLVLLALAPSNEWYRYRGWLRATGKG
jgi:hypothetical protein